MTHWYKDETRQVGYNFIDQTVNDLSQKYKTNLVMVPRIFDHDKKIDIDVWFNFDTSMHMITVHVHRDEGQ